DCVRLGCRRSIRNSPTNSDGMSGNDAVRDTRMRNPVNVLVEYLDQILNRHGFKRRGRVWTRKHEEVTPVVDLQKSRYSRDHYVNLGVLIHRLSDGARAQIECCQITDRLNMLVLEGTPTSRMAEPLEGPNGEQAQALLDSFLSQPRQPVHL